VASIIMEVSVEADTRFNATEVIFEQGGYL